mgnify:CR=1 FL=1
MDYEANLAMGTCMLMQVPFSLWVGLGAYLERHVFHRGGLGAQKHPNSAVSYFKKALGTQPRSVLANFGLGYTHSLLGQVRGASQHNTTRTVVLARPVR